MTPSLEELLRWSPPDLLAWIREGGYLEAGGAVNWLGLAEATSANAMSDLLSESDHRAWAEVTYAALRRAEIYQKLPHIETAIRWLRLNSALISRSTNGTAAALDADTLIGVFEEEIALTSAEVSRMIDQVGDSFEYLVTLRAIKPLISSLRYIAGHVKESRARSVLDEWTDIYARLP